MFVTSYGKNWEDSRAARSALNVLACTSGQNAPVDSRHECNQYFAGWSYEPGRHTLEVGAHKFEYDVLRYESQHLNMPSYLAVTFTDEAGNAIGEATDALVCQAGHVGEMAWHPSCGAYCRECGVK